MRDEKGKIRYVRNGKFCFTVFTSYDGKKFFFSTSHMQGFEEGDVQFNKPENWVACSFSLPMRISIREDFPDGMVITIEEYISVFHKGETEITNPDPNYIPEFRRK